MQYGDLTWPELRAQAAAGKVVVMLTGSLEQHGHHLPLLTDSMIGEGVAARAEAALGDEALFLPMLWVGASHHHLHFATVSLSTPLYVEVLKEMLGCVLAAGFRKIFVLNAHGGNEVPAMLAIQQVHLANYRTMPDLYVTFSSWFGSVAGAQIAAISSLRQKRVSHACELETSAMLTLRPNLVYMDKARGQTVAETSAFWGTNAHSPSRVMVGTAFDQMSATGALDRPEDATADKGEALLQVAAEQIVAFVRDFAAWRPMAERLG
jgi:creatinine amidohydrolase